MMMTSTVSEELLVRETHTHTNRQTQSMVREGGLKRGKKNQKEKRWKEGQFTSFFLYLLKAYTPVNRSGSPQGFPLVQTTDLKIEWIAHRCRLIRCTVEPAEAILGFVSVQPTIALFSFTVRFTACASFSRLLSHCTVEFQYGGRLTLASTAMRDPFYFEISGSNPIYLLLAYSPPSQPLGVTSGYTSKKTNKYK